LTEVRVKSGSGKTAKIKCGNTLGVTVVDENGNAVEHNIENNAICFNTDPGETYILSGFSVVVKPERITELKPNEVFVFGSNLAGAHGGGAAWLAYNRFGAIWGQGTGLQGQSYGIPTMQGGVETIRPYVDEFISFAKTRPDLKFYVTQIGCGIAGFRVG
jgi:hypothetical protein